MTIKRYRRHPVDVSAIQWDGKKSTTSLILNWVQMQGVSATSHRSFEGDPNCQNLIYHGMYGKCPTCSFHDDTPHLMIDGLRLDIGGFIVSDPAGGFLLYPADEFLQGHEEVS